MGKKVLERREKTSIKINPVVKQILIGVVTRILVSIIGKLIDLRF